MAAGLFSAPSSTPSSPDSRGLSAPPTAGAESGPLPAIPLPRSRVWMVFATLLLVGMILADGSMRETVLAVGGHLVEGGGRSRPPLRPPAAGGAEGATAGVLDDSDPRGPTIAALLTVYRNPKAVLVSASAYRDAYPEGDLILLGDDGCMDYTDAGVFFGMTKMFAPEPISTKTNGGLYMQRQQFDHFRDVWKRMLPYVRARWIFLLDTDSIVYKRVTSPIKHAVNGLVPIRHGWLVGGPLAYATKANPSFSASNFPGGKVPYGGQGGTILSMPFIRFLAEMDDGKWAAEMDLFFHYATTQGADQILCALAYRFNYTVGDYADFAHADDDSTPGRVASGSAAVVHPDKSAYKIPLTPEDMAILGPNYNVVMSYRRP